jgi:hypothetical protein
MGAWMGDKRVGEVRRMNCGLKATIIDYKSTLDVTIEFEKGGGQKRVIYSAFRSGRVLPDISIVPYKDQYGGGFKVFYAHLKGFWLMDKKDLHLLSAGRWSIQKKKHVTLSNGGTRETYLAYRILGVNRVDVKNRYKITFRNGNYLDYRRKNMLLRPWVNIIKTKSSTGYQGVSVVPSKSGLTEKYMALVCVRGVRHRSKLFVTPEAAHKEYKKMCYKYR